MAMSAEQVVAAVAEDAGALAVDLADLSGDVQVVNALVRKQADGVADLRGASATITALARSINGLAENSRRVAADAADQVMRADNEAGSALGAIEQLIAAVGAISTKAPDLRAAMERIGAVATSIDRIARQTNLRRRGRARLCRGRERGERARAPDQRRHRRYQPHPAQPQHRSA
jgi:methyl-accepting chemotaxis protein